MEELTDILMGVVPAVVVGVIVYLLVGKFLKAEGDRHLMEIRRETVKFSMPIRMQAYERMVLLLERVDPVKSVNRVIQPNMTARQLQKRVLADIRNEFDHNITQQLYVSKNAWEEVKKAKEESLKVLAVTITRVPDDADAIVYTQVLIKVLAELDMANISDSVELVKREAKKIF